MHMKKVMMMRPKLVLKESMRVNQYMPPYEETAQQGEQSHGHTEGFLGLNHTYISHQQETHQVESKAQGAQEQGLMQGVGSELRELVQDGCGDALHVAKLWKNRRSQTPAHTVVYRHCRNVLVLFLLTSVSIPNMKSMRKNIIDQNTEPGSRARASG